MRLIALSLLAALAFTPVSEAKQLVAAPCTAHAIDVTGTYDSNWGPITLTQQGTKVHGTYAFRHGRLDGTLDGNVLRYTWTEDDGTGRGVFVVASDGELVGTWGGGTDEVSGGGWQLKPAGAAIAH